MYSLIEIRNVFAISAKAFPWKKFKNWTDELTRNRILFLPNHCVKTHNSQFYLDYEIWILFSKSDDVFCLKVDMVEIKELYQKTNLRSLADDIREYYTDDVKNILLALIKGTDFLIVLTNHEKHKIVTELNWILKISIKFLNFLFCFRMDSGGKGKHFS